MMNYEGYEIKHKKQVAMPKPIAPKRSPYMFHYEDWTGEEVYNGLFPRQLSLRQFGMQMIVLFILLIVMRFAAGVM